MNPPNIHQTPDLEVRHLIKNFGSSVAVEKVSFSVQAGEFLSLLGPSGCGKSTTLRMVAGFIAPDGGQVLLKGQDISALPPYKRDVGLLFQNYALFPHLTVRDNVGFGPRMKNMSRAETRAKVAWALDLVRLGGMEDRFPQQLSGGQQQRVAVARVLAAGASVLLLDEPFSNLDAKLKTHMQEELRELQQRLGIATIHVTHDQEEAMMMSDRIIVMNSGRVEQEGTPEAIYREPRSTFVAEFMGRCNKLTGPASVQADGMQLDFGSSGTLRASGIDADRIGAGGELTVFIRPEHLNVAPHTDTGTGTAAGSNRLTGTVRQRVFIGERTAVLIDLSEGRSVTAHVTNSAGAGTASGLPPVGAAISFHVAPEAIRHVRS